MHDKHVFYPGIPKILKFQSNFAANACFLCGRCTKMCRYTTQIAGNHASIYVETLEESCSPLRESGSFRSVNSSSLAIITEKIGCRYFNHEYRECYPCLHAYKLMQQDEFSYYYCICGVCLFGLLYVYL